MRVAARQFVSAPHNSMLLTQKLLALVDGSGPPQRLDARLEAGDRAPGVLCIVAQLVDVPDAQVVPLPEDTFPD